MADSTHVSGAPSMKDAAAHLVSFVAIFVVFLAIALVAQLLGLEWRSWFPGAEGEKSVIGGVKAAAYSLMSYLD